MYWIDAYSELYQKANGFPITIFSKPYNKKGYLSMKPTTRAAYDLSMRENSIDGIITLDNIQKELKAGMVFSIDTEPESKYIIQTYSYWEQQPNTRNINAVRCNCYITVQRYGFKDSNSTEEEWYEVYKDINGFVSETLKEGKNFNAGVEVNTWKVVQIPKFDIDENIYDIKETDRVLVRGLLNSDRYMKINLESVDAFGINGVIRMQGNLDMRND